MEQPHHRNDKDRTRARQLPPRPPQRGVKRSTPFYGFKPACGYPVLGREQDLPALVKRHSLAGVLIAIADNFVRAFAAAQIRALCLDLRFVSPAQRC